MPPSQIEFKNYIILLLENFSNYNKSDLDCSDSVVEQDVLAEQRNCHVSVVTAFPQGTQVILLNQYFNYKSVFFKII